MLVLKGTDLLLESFYVSCAKLIELYAYIPLVRTPKEKRKLRDITKPPETAVYVLIKY